MKRFFYAETFILMLLVVISRPAWPDEAPPAVELNLTECTKVSAPEVRRLFNLEMQSLMVGHTDAIPCPTAVEVVCAPDGISFIAEDLVTGKQQQRRMQSGRHYSEAMERIIAIAATEFVLSTWEQRSSFDQSADPATEAGSAVIPPVPATDANDRSSSNEKGNDSSSERNRHSAALRLSALWRLYPDSSLNLFGGEIGGRFPIAFPFHGSFSIGTERGRAHRAIGSVSMVSVSGAIAFGAHGRVFPWMHAGADIGFRGGYGAMIGYPESQTSVGKKLHGGAGGPLFRLSLASNTRFAVGAALEIGYAVFGMTGLVDTGQSIAMKGFWLSAQIDFLYFFLQAEHQLGTTRMKTSTPTNR